MRQVHVIVVGASAVVLLACQKQPPAPAAPVAVAASQQEATVAVQTAPVTVQKLPPTLELSGTLTADEQSDVAASAPGVVTEVTVDVGSRVRKGQVLVRIDRRDAAMRLAQASAGTAQAVARLGIKAGEAFNPQRLPEVQMAREASDLAEMELKRAKALVEGGSAAQSLLDQARSRAEQTRNQYDAALNGARQAWAGLQAARAAQDLTEKASSDTEVRAPYDGVINEKRINPGEYAMPGKVVAVLLRDDPVRLRVDVPEGEVGRVTIGSTVLVTVAAWPGRVFEGKVQRVGAALKTGARALPVEADLANREGALKPGFFAKASVVLEGTPREAFLVPASAIGSSGSAARLFVIEGGRAVERIVAVGRTWQGLVEVRGALKSGDRVATEGVAQLTDGARVTTGQ